jgi:hypothetical protein
MGWSKQGGSGQDQNQLIALVNEVNGQKGKIALMISIFLHEVKE